MEVGSGSSSNSSTSTSSGSLNGLKFDKKSYFGESSPPAESKRPPLAPGKKGGVVVQGGQRCQVEGCEFDLRSVKGYYYRHRVCGIHSKSAKVIVNGVEQRFCQQCSRFHLVPEFDKGKRSCRRRLACHNQRRRKPPSDGNGTLFSCNGSSKSESSSSKAGSFMLDFSVQPPVLIGSGDSHSNPYAETDAHPWHRNPPEIATRSNIFGSQECLTGVSDCSRALSLLSTQNWDSRHQSSIHDEGVINALVTTPPMMVQVLQPSDSSHNEEESIHGLSNTLCRRSLKASETISHMSTEVGLIETSQPAGNHYHYHGHVDDMVQQNESGFVGLFEQSVEYDSDSSLPQHSRGYGYDSFLQNMVL